MAKIVEVNLKNESWTNEALQAACSPIPRLCTLHRLPRDAVLACPPQKRDTNHLPLWAATARASFIAAIVRPSMACGLATCSRKKRSLKGCGSLASGRSSRTQWFECLARTCFSKKPITRRWAKGRSEGRADQPRLDRSTKASVTQPSRGNYMARRLSRWGTRDVHCVACCVQKLVVCLGCLDSWQALHDVRLVLFAWWRPCLCDYPYKNSRLPDNLQSVGSPPKPSKICDGMVVFPIGGLVVFRSIGGSVGKLRVRVRLVSPSLIAPKAKDG